MNRNYINVPPRVRFNETQITPVSCWAACIEYISGLYDDTASQDALDGLISSVSEAADIPEIIEYCRNVELFRYGNLIPYDPKIYNIFEINARVNLVNKIPQILACYGKSMGHACVLVGCEENEKVIINPVVWDPWDDTIKPAVGDIFKVVVLWREPCQ